ncbi:MAG: hypothetical protein V3573_00845 [Desulfovibrionaceae bacterium]
MIPSLALGLILHPCDTPFVARWLERHVPHADALLVVIDAPGPEHAPQAETLLQRCFHEHPERLLLRYRPLGRDFAAQRNACAALNPCDWLLMLDADESLEERTLTLLRPALAELLRTRPGLRVLGLPRENLLDGMPTGVWPDYQFRLVRRGVRWRNTHPALNASPGCHEFPEEVHDRPESVAVLDAVRIRHEKTSDRQVAQNALYDSY